MSEAAKHIPERRKEDRGMSGRVTALEEAMRVNTEATQEVLEIVSMGRSFFKVLGHIGAAIKWCAGLTTAGGVLYSIWPHGTPPK